MEENQSNAVEKEAATFVDAVLGNVDSINEESIANAENDVPVSSKADSTSEGQSAPQDNALKAQLERYEKRLRDTQAKLHEVCNERAELKKQLESFNSSSDDDWFTDDDVKKKTEIEEKLKATDAKLEELDKQNTQHVDEERYASWNAQCDAVRKVHPDFDKVVIDDFGNLVDPNSASFDPVIHKAYMALPDKSPAAVYDYAKSLKERESFINDPAKYREQIRQEVLKEVSQGRDPIGRAGLAMLNSGRSTTAPAADIAPEDFTSRFLAGR